MGLRRWTLRAAWVVVGLLLVLAVPVTTVRLLEPGFAWAVQLESFTPLALPVYAAALILLVLAAVLAAPGDRGRRVAAGVSVPVAAGLALHGWWFAPMLTGDAPAAAEQGRLTVMTSNIWRGAGDPEQLVAAVRADGVDLLVVTEITPASLTALDDAGLTELLPHRAGRPDPDSDLRGTMVFAAEPLRTVERVETELDSLVVAAGDLTVLAVHPVAPLDATRWQEEHEALLAATREHRPELVVGDFNATLDHAPMRTYEDLGYRDAVELDGGGYQPTWPTHRGPGLVGLAGIVGPVAQLDHVLVDGDHTVVDVATRELADADHRYVVADVAPAAEPG